MRHNEEEIPGVSDVSPLSQKKKKSNSKKSLKSLIEAIPPYSNYRPVQHLQERNAQPNLPDNVDPDKPSDFYELFLTRQHQALFASHTNIRAYLELRKLSKQNTQQREWHNTNEWEIGVFLGIILLMSLDHSPRIEDYWKNNLDKPIYTAIQRAMSIIRFQQIKRFFKMSDPRNDADSTGPDWWKKLEPFASDFQKASLQYYLPGSHVSIDEQLVLFKGRSRHTMQLHVKEASQGFKLYTLCEGNYLLAFLFTSLVRQILFP